MEKRFVLFIVLSLAVMVGWFGLMNLFAPPKPPVVRNEQNQNDPQQPDDQQPDALRGVDDQPPAPNEVKPDVPTDDPNNEPGNDDPAEEQPVDAVAEDQPKTLHELNRHSLGSLHPSSGFRMLVTTISRGAAIERVELTSPKYRDLEDKSGYFGQLALSDEPQGAGCRVNAVGSGTPAAIAGVQLGDVIREIDGQKISNTEELSKLLGQSKPGETISLTLQRVENEKTTTLQVQVDLTRRPLELIRPEPHYTPGVANNLDARHPMSCLLTLLGPGAQRSQRLDNYLRYAQWEIVSDKDDPTQVVFQIEVGPELLQRLGQTGRVKIIKRYSLQPAPADQIANEYFKAYHLGLDIEIQNIGQETDEAPPNLAYQLDGPNGLPDEGWWYANKIHPTKFSGAGIRDVMWNSAGQGHTLIGCPKIFKDATGKAEFSMLFTKNDPATFTDEVRSVKYIGVDAHYFSAVLIPSLTKENKPYVFDRGIAAPVVKPDKESDRRRVKRVNVSFQLTSATQTISRNDPFQQSYVLFLGPKQSDLLAQYELDECITYGWFPWVAKPLIAILHFFHGIVSNYALSIILLTVLVRGLMFPLSRKAAKNMLVTQTLAPEMKKIKEKYKTDMEKQGKAMRELYRKHNFNPLSGCWMMFVQLPIFLGLYRGLSTDIALRGQPLIPGLSWCSNLVAPDQLFFWKPYIWAFFADEATGWLGPFLNVLPLITISLFLLQQKMFTPPATDDQTRQQQKMMKYMMLFMGVMFFKVAAGLCIYFITSSLWGIAERKLIPKPVPPDEKSSPTPAKSAPKPGSNGSSQRAKNKKKQKQKRK